MAGIECPTRDRNDRTVAELFATPTKTSISLDTVPSYIIAGLGYNLAFGYFNTKSTLIDYPTKNEESEFELSFVYLATSFFYVWGNKAFHIEKKVFP